MYDELFLTLVAINKYKKDGYIIEGHSHTPWNYMIDMNFPGIKKTYRGGYDIIMSRDGIITGVELKVDLTIGNFDKALGQCIRRLFQETKITECKIAFNRISEMSFLKFEDVLNHYNLPITLERISVTEEEMSHEYWEKRAGFIPSVSTLPTTPHRY